MTIDINLNINATEIAEAIKSLADAIASRPAHVTLTGAPTKVEGGEIMVPKDTALIVADIEPPKKPTRKRSKPAAAETPAEPEQPEPEQPAPTEPESMPEQPAEPQPAPPAPAKPVPTIDQIVTAGAEMLDAAPNKMPALLNLLTEFGVLAVTQLRPEQLGPFAERLRALGAEV